MKVKFAKSKAYAVLNILIVLAIALTMIGCGLLSSEPQQQEVAGSSTPSPVVYDTPEPVLVQYSTLDAQAQKETEAVRLTSDAANGFFVMPDDISEEDYQATVVAQIAPSAGYDHLYNASVDYASTIDSILLIQDTYDEWAYWETDEGKETQKSLDIVLNYSYWAYRRSNIFASRSAEYPLSVFPSLPNHEGSFSVDDPLIGPNVASEDYPLVYPYQEDIDNLPAAVVGWDDFASAPEIYYDTVMDIKDGLGAGQVEIEMANKTLNMYSDEEMEIFKQTYMTIYIQFLTSLYS